MISYRNMAPDYADLDDTALRALHDVSEKYEERSCIRAELRKRKKKLSDVASSSNNSGIGNKNRSSALAIETPLTNGFATPGRTLGHGVGSKSMGVSELGKEVRQNDERYDSIRDEKILQSMLNDTRELDKRVHIRAALRALRHGVAKTKRSDIPAQDHTARQGDTVRQGDSNRHGDSNGHGDSSDTLLTANCQTLQTTLRLDDTNRWSLADYKTRKARNMELHRSALSEEPLSTATTDLTQEQPEGSTAADRDSTSESCSSDSESDSQSSADTVITTESNGAIRVTSRVQSHRGVNGDRSCDNRTNGGVLSLGKIIDDKIGKDGCKEGTPNNKAQPSSECGSTHGDTESKEESKIARQDEPTALESLTDELKEMENKLHSSRDFEVRQKLRADIRDIRALIKELSVVVQSPTYCHNSASVAPSNGDTVVPGNCEMVVIEHHVPREHVRHQTHNGPQSSHLSDSDVVMVTSSDSDKEGLDSPCEQEVTGPPPRVTAPLTDRTVVAGQSATFECTVADGDDASIRWFHDSEQLEPSEEYEHIFDGCVARLVIARVLPTCAGTYRCMVLTPGGETETSASITVEAQRHAPEVTETLRDVTARVCDSHVVLQCRLCGLPLPRVTWYHNALLLKDSTGSTQQFDGDLARLTLTAVSHDHTGEYQCVARNVSGETRTVCQLTVQEALQTPEETLTDTPEQMVASTPEQTVADTPEQTLADTPEQILVDTPEQMVADTPEQTLILVVDTPERTLADIPEQIVADTPEQTLADIPEQIVADTPEQTLADTPEQTSPLMTLRLTDTNVVNGDTATLECHVTGQPTPDVTWHKDDELLSPCSARCQSYVDGVARLVLDDVVATIAGMYRCTAKNLAGEANSEAKVVVSAVPTPALEHSKQPSKRPIFLKPLEDLSLTEGSTVNLECSVLAHPAPSISWFWNRAPFEPSPECSLSFDGVLATLQIEAVSAELSGMFKCVATNSLGSARTLCNLSVQGKPRSRITGNRCDDMTPGSDVLDGYNNMDLPEPVVTVPTATVVTNVQMSSTNNMADTSAIDGMEDEEKLHDLLSQTDNFDERRKIRARLRAVREEKSAEWAKKRAERDAARVEANNLRQQQSEQAKLSKMKQFAEQAKDQRRGSGAAENAIRRRVAEADAEKQRKLEEYKEIGKVMSAAYHNGSDMATRNAIAMADRDKERRLAEFDDEAVSRTMSVETLADGSVSTTNTSVSTMRSKDGKTTTTRQTKQVTKIGGVGGTAYVSNRPGAEETARRLADTFSQRGYPQTSGLIRVKTESWSSDDGARHHAQKTSSWAGGRVGPGSAMAAFKNLDAANGPTGGRPNIGGGKVGVQRSASTVKQMLLDWCRSMTVGYKNVDITNFSTSWNNGMAFCALIHHFFPQSFEFDKLNPKNRRFNFTLGFEVAEKMANIAPLLDVEDMVRMKNPDWKCVFTTVQSYYRWYRMEENKNNGVAPGSPSPVTTPVTTSAANPFVAQ